MNAYPIHPEEFAGRRGLVSGEAMVRRFVAGGAVIDGGAIPAA